MTRKFTLVPALMLGTILCCAQNIFTLNPPADMVKDNISRAANDFAEYETLDLTERPVPEGYEPFYAIVMTRGGVRDKGGLLPESREETAAIAERAVKRFPGIWRSASAMTSYAMPSNAEDEQAFLSALGTTAAITRLPLAEQAESERCNEKDSIKMLLRHARLEPDTALKIWKEDNRNLFHNLCVSRENKGETVATKEGCFAGILEELRTAARSGIAGASMRFMDKSTFQAILSIIGASGNDYVMTEDDCNSHYAGFISLCSNANFQIILYKNTEGRVLVKMLMNEREVGLRALFATGKVYYNWESLDRYFSERLQGSYRKPALIESVIYNRILKNDDTGLKVSGQVKAPGIGSKCNPFWSMDCGTLDRDYADFRQYKPFLNELGAGYVRIQSGWQKTERKKDEYSFEWLDEIVDGIIEEGLTPWITLGYGNTNYCQSGTSLASEIFTDEATMAAWCRYVEAVVKRYKGKVAAYEVWNEPDFGNTLRRAVPYANLFARTAPVIRANDPSAKIIGFALGAGLGLDFVKIVLDNLKQTNTLQYLDIISYHPYTSRPEKNKGRIEGLASLAAGYSPGIRLMSGESGQISELYVRNQKESTELIQAKWVLRQMALGFGYGHPTSIFSMIDNLYPDRLQSFGMIRANILKEAVYKRPSFHAYRHLTAILDAGAVSGGDIPVETSAEGGFTAKSICRNGRTTGIIIWDGSAAPGNGLSKKKADFKFSGIHLDDPVYVDPLTGRIHEYKTWKNTSKGFTARKLPVWDSPVIIMERAEL